MHSRSVLAYRAALMGVALFATAISAVSPAYAAAPPPSAGRSGSCQFVLGFKTFHDDLSDPVGDCKGDQHFATNGDAQQETAGGLLVWRKSDNWTAFTDGFHTWVNGPLGLAGRLNTERFDWEVRGQKRASRQFHILPTGQVAKTTDSASLGPLMHI